MNQLLMSLLLAVLFFSCENTMHRNGTGSGNAENAEKEINKTTEDSSSGEIGIPEKLVRQQLEAYNARDIDAFLEPYADDLEVYNFPNNISGKGKENIRPQYESMFANLTDLNCEVVNRMVLGNTVIDHEKITGFPNTEYFEAIAIYKIENDKIAQVYFIRK